MFISKAVIRQTQDANKALILQEIYEAIAAGQTTYSALEEIGNGYITNDLTMSSIQALAEAGYITIYESKWARDNKKIFKIELGVLSETL